MAGERGGSTKPTYSWLPFEGVANFVNREGHGSGTIRMTIGWLPFENISNFVRVWGIKEEVERLDEIEKRWETAHERFSEISVREAGEAETIESRELGEELGPMVKELKNDPIFMTNFRGPNIQFKMVELSKLATFPLYVHLDYVEKLKASLENPKDERELFTLCMSSDKRGQEISDFRTGESSYTFTSPGDLRYLGSTVRDFDPKDVRYSPGGLPTKTLVVFLGFGAPRVNAYEVNNRYLLNNGMHRLYALYAEGVRYAPVIVQRIRDPTLNFPQSFYDLPRDFVLKTGRPPLLKDFFDKKLTLDLKIKTTARTVRLNIAHDDSVTPF
jgi:hypothetical protein